METMLKSILFILITLCTLENSLLSAQPLQLPSLEQITQSPTSEQEIPEHDEPLLTEKPSFATWCKFQLQCFALTCALKYYTIKAWIRQTVLQRTT